MLETAQNLENETPLSIGVFNVGLPEQARRLESIAEYLYRISKEEKEKSGIPVGCWVLPELDEANHARLSQALNTLAGDYELDIVSSNTIGHPELAIGIVTTEQCSLVDLKGGPSGRKVRQLAAATLAIKTVQPDSANKKPTTIVKASFFHGDWLPAKGLKEQFKNADGATHSGDGEEVAAQFIAGDTNLPRKLQDRILNRLGYTRYSPNGSTWPNPAGRHILEGLLDQSAARTALLLEKIPLVGRLGLTSMDAVYGKGDIKPIGGHVYSGQNPDEFPVSPSDHFAVIGRSRLVSALSS